MKTALLKKLREAIEEWAQAHNVEATLIEAKYIGIGSHVHVRVVARRGFENWSRHERHDSLFDFLHDKLESDGDLVISRLSTMTEAEYEKYEEVEV